jgi:uncharacterized coiled-coil protein SlyX
VGQNTESLERCVQVIATGIERRLQRIDELVVAIAEQMRQIEGRRQAIRALMDELRDG